MTTSCSQWLLIIVFVTLGFPMPVRADIAIVVSPKNPVRVLNGDAVRRIFGGTLRTFPSTGLAATALDQPQSASVHIQFYKKMLKATPERMKRRRAAYLFSGQGTIPKIVADDAAIKAMIKEKPSAIGYIDATAVDSSVVVVYLIRE